MKTPPACPCISRRQVLGIKRSPKGGKLRPATSCEHFFRPTLERFLLTRKSVLVKASPRLAAEIASVDHLFQQCCGAIFRITEILIEYIHHREEGVEADQIGESQWTDRMICSQFHT